MKFESDPGNYINIASTVAIDCAVLGRPAVCISFDSPEKNIPYWQSVHRLHDTFDHYEKLISTEGVWLVKSQDELVRAINSYMKDGSLKKNGRKKILELFVNPFDGNSGNRLANLLTESKEFIKREGKGTE